MSTAPHHYEVGGWALLAQVLVLAIVLGVLLAGPLLWVCVLYQRLPLLRA